ncbi:hypothetical protein NPIL_459141 [Nephila pilipes]|uniref:HTH CENPB-type domain-containing protein n=1 Tax=Nephila pilipes TaxID=299642 RepID=A0A8X6PPY1_NEPPI|nr:hypothetical protein NPIL_459141 [Nephila pilipes]
MIIELSLARVYRVVVAERLRRWTRNPLGSSRYKQDRTSSIPLDRNILRERAPEIAASNDMDNFSASNEWISHLKIFHGDDDNADEERSPEAKDAFDMKLSDKIHAVS